jgi:hypothetical protein
MMRFTRNKGQGALPSRVPVRYTNASSAPLRQVAKAEPQTITRTVAKK